MTALGVLAIGAGGLLIYAGVTGQSALQLVTDTLSGQQGASGPSFTKDDVDDVKRDKTKRERKAQQ